ncbi:MAG: FtsX-like permease family protein [archaeon]
MVLYESLFIGILGGIFGIALGFGAAQIIASFGLVTKVSLQLAVGSFFGAIIVGLIGGLYPAFIASRMDPIEALRSE